MAVTAEQVLKAMQDAGKPVRPGDVAKALDADSKEVSKAIDERRNQAKFMSPEALLLRSGRVALPVNKLPRFHPLRVASGGFGVVEDENLTWRFSIKIFLLPIFPKMRGGSRSGPISRDSLFLPDRVSWRTR